MMDNEGVDAAAREPAADAARILLAVPQPERDAMFPAGQLERLKELGHVTIAEPEELRDDDEFAAALAGVNILVTAWGFPRLDAGRLGAAPQVRFVMHAASSVKALVSDDFWATGVPLSQAGSAMAPAVAELSLTLTLALLRRTHRTDHQLRAGGDWDRARLVPRAREIAGARIGVLGASRTGRAYIQLVSALGADVTVFDPYIREADPLHERRRDLQELLETSDVLALHAPVTAETRGMIGEAELSLLRDGALLVNTARAELLDADALYREVASGRLDAALDVFEIEPVTDRWRALPNVLITPHLGGATVESRLRAGSIVVREIERFLAGEPLENAVVRADLDRMG